MKIFAVNQKLFYIKAICLTPFLMACATSSYNDNSETCHSQSDQACEMQKVNQRIIISFIETTEFNTSKTIDYLENISGAKIIFIQQAGKDAGVYFVETRTTKQLEEALKNLERQKDKIFKYVEHDGKVTIN